MAISLADIKTKRKKIDPITNNIVDVESPTVTSPKRTINIADVKSGKVKLTSIIEEQDNIGGQELANKIMGIVKDTAKTTSDALKVEKSKVNTELPKQSAINKTVNTPNEFNKKESKSTRYNPINQQKKAKVGDKTPVNFDVSKYKDKSKQEDTTKIKYKDGKPVRVKNEEEGLLPTIHNGLIMLGKGALGLGESIVDTGLQIGTSKYNPFMYLLDESTRKDSQKLAEEMIKEDATGILMDKLGYNQILSNGKTLQEQLDSKSFVKSDNFSGQVLESVGNMLPSIMLGGLGTGSAGASTLMGINSYGSGIDEAYNEGANRKEANLYGLGSTALETATEYITGGVPGISKFSKIGLDNVAEAGLKKIPNKIAREAGRIGYKAVGEGIEEGVSEIAKPYLKNATYSKGEKIDWNQVKNATLMGATSGLILNSPADFYNMNQAIKEQINTKRNRVNENVQTIDSNENVPIYSQDSLVDNPKIKNQVSDMDFKQSARNYNIDVNNDTIKSIDKTLSQRGIKAKFDSSVFISSNENAFWQVNKDGSREVVFNPNAQTNDVLENVAIHELYHDISNSKNGQQLQKELLDFAKTKEGYDEARQSLEQLYSSKYDPNSDQFKTLVDEEAVASILGKKLGNQEFVSSLTVEKPSVAKSVYNWVVDKLNKLNKLTGYKSEKLFWKDIKNKFDSAYRNKEQYIGNSNNRTRFHINQNLSKNIDNVLTNIKERNPVKLRDYTPDVLVKNGIKNLPMYENPSHIRKNILTKEEAKNIGLSVNSKDHYHGLGKEIYIKAIDSLDNPRVIFKNKNNKDYLILTMVKDKNNNNVIVPIEIETKTDVNKVSIDINRVKSIYGYNKTFPNLNQYIKYNIKNSSLVKIYEQKKQSTNIASQSAFSKNNISDSNQNVKSDTKYSMQSGEKNTKELDNSSFSFDKNKTLTLEDRVSGNELLDAQDLIQELKDANAEVDKNGYVIVYHQTSEGNAKKIQQSGKMISKERDVFFSTSKEAQQASGRGQVKLKFKIPVEKLLLDDIFSDNADVKIHLNGKESLDVSNYLVSDDSQSTKYSLLNTDNQGRTLSKGQQEFFKDSKVRDKKGNLKVLYHGTPNEFYRFDYSHIGDNGTALGKGFYLAENINSAKAYATNENGKNGHVLEVYANITKPMSLKEKTISRSNFKKFIEAIDKKTNNQFLSGYGDVEYEGYNNVLNTALESYDYSDNDVDLIHDVLNTASLSWEEGFRLLKDTLGYDGVINEVKFKSPITGKVESDSVYVPVLPEQIKLVSNKTPTNNEDIRYSQSNNKWQNFVDQNFQTEGTGHTLSQLKTNKALNPTEIANLAREDASTTPNLPDVKVPKGDKKSKFTKNISEKTKMLTEENRKKLSQEKDVAFYKGITNKQSLDEAYSRLNDGGSGETLSWLSRNSFDKNGKLKQKPTATDVAEGWILLKQYQDAGDYDSMVQVAKVMRQMGTEAGQTVQAYNIMSRLTPEGMVKYAQSELDEAYNQMVKNKTKQWIDKNRDKFTLTPDETAYIVDKIKEASQLPDGYDKKVKLAQIQSLISNKLPPARGAGIKAWMRISMLFNAKTQIRNIMGNAVITPVNAISDTFSALVDRQVAKKTGVRTTGVPNVKNYAKGFKKGLYESYNDFKLDINTRDMQGNRFEIGEGKSFSNRNKIGKALNQTDRVLSFMLDAGDRPFYEATFINSINNQKILNNTDTVTQDMIDIATTEALQRTWQDNNEYTKFVLNTRRGLNKANIKGYGIGDALIPFAKTPANLTKALVDYSPAGLVTTLVEGNKLKNAIETGSFTPQMQHKFVQNLGKAMAGSFLYILGYALAKNGITTGANDDDKDIANFMKNTLGIQPYSIKIGNHSFTYDWAQPVSTPFAIMSNYVKYSEENPEASVIDRAINAMNIGTEQLLEQSFMESLNTVLNGNGKTLENLSEAILELPSRAVPTFIKQINDMIDTTQRTSYESDEPIETAKNKVKNKIPGLSKDLAPSRDSLGREIKKYGGDVNIFNVFFNPANTSKGKVSESAKEIYKIYQETGDKTIMPRVAPYSIMNGGEKVSLTSKERSEFQKISGQIVEKNVKELAKTSKYKKLDDSYKAEAIKGIVDYSYNYAKSEILDQPISKNFKKAYEYTQKGGALYDFYADKVYKNSKEK